MKILCTILVLAMVVVSFAGCTKSSGAANPPQNVPNRTFIPAAQANRMIGSYLTSIGYPQRDDRIRSWVLNADSLRYYLKDTSIRRIKVFIAHNQQYIDGGNEGQPPAQGIIPETIIVTGINRHNDYVLVIDHAMDNSVPCPRMCDLNGPVASPFIE